MIEFPSMDHQIELLKKSLSPIRQEILGHELYRSLTSAGRLQTFMEYHVFAVWDFMSLVKTLQAKLTSVTIPWVPKADRDATRLINEIVLAEESDEHPGGGYVSHFELYRQAMKQAGADTKLIDALIERIENGQPLDAALKRLDAPPFIEDFIKTTFSFIKKSSIHEIAAVFTFGREDLIPSMFQKIVKKIDREYKGCFELFEKYLERHIQLDEFSHTPLALRLVSELCGNDERKWQESREAAFRALAQRKALWDGIFSATSLPNISN